MAIYLGLDSSTQGLTAIAIEIDGASRRLLLEKTLVFDAALPRYGTRHGVLLGDDPLVAVAPPRMWAEALDVMMGELAASGLDLASVRAVAGAAQQHGTVYLADGAGDRLARLDPAVPLVDQIDPLLSRATSPIWQDSSTTRECAEITQALGGCDALARLTGSRAFERFSGPQIRKFAQTDPSAYARTERVHLVSSFLASLLAGGHAPTEPGDGSGMNLMNIRSGQWAGEAVALTAPGLARKLPDLCPSWTIVGPMAPYWRRRHGWPPASVVAWSGDNPSSLVGVGLVQEGCVAISLGTSDTIFGLMREPRTDPSGAGHVFASPTGAFMGLTCFRNGSLAREAVRDAHGLDWRSFSAALEAVRPGNGSGIMLPWFEPEITPFVPAAGIYRFGIDPGDAVANVRGVIEGQMMAMVLHSRWMGVDIDTIRVTGGASVNREVLQIMADVFGADVYRLAVTNAAALGAALRAWHADQVSRGDVITWAEVVDAFTAPVIESRVRPREGSRAVYDELMRRYASHEAIALRPSQQ